MSPTTSANEHRQQLQAYGTPLVEYHGHGTVRWKNGTSKDLAFEAGQFPSGKISFLDRVFLKLFGYSGDYFDWRDFPRDQGKTRTLP